MGDIDWDSLVVGFMLGLVFFAVFVQCLRVVSNNSEEINDLIALSGVKMAKGVVYLFVGLVIVFGGTVSLHNFLVDFVDYRIKEHTEIKKQVKK